MIAEKPRVATSVRPLAPSARELETGQAIDAVLDARPAGPVEERPKVPVSARLRTMVTELNPWVVTGGLNPFPMLVFAAGGFVYGLHAQSMVFVLPNVREIGVNALVAAALANATAYGFNAGAVGLGFLADRYGLRAWYLRLGNLLRALGTVGMGFAAGAPMYMAGYALTSAGAQLSQPAVSMLADYYPPDVRIRQGFFSTKIAQLAVLIGPVVTGFIVLTLGWQWALVLLGFLAAPVVVLSFFVKEPRQGAADAPDVPEIALPPISFGQALTTMVSVRTMRWILIGLPVIAASLGVVGFSTLYFAGQWQLGPVSRGLVLSAGGAAGIVGLVALTPVYRSFAAYRQGRLLTMAAILLAVEAICALGMIGAPTVQVAIACFVVIGFIVPTVQACVTNLMLFVVPARVRTMAVEVINFGVLLSLIVLLVGPPLGSLVFSWGGVTLAQSQLLIAGFVPAMALASLVLLRASRTVESDLRSAIAVAHAEAVVTQARSEGVEKLLVARGVEVQVAGAQILFGVDLDIEQGEMVALLGTNGAGKSTLLRAISGVRPAFSGGIFFDGEDITHASAHANAARGIVMLPGGHAVFPDLTVAENLRAAAWLDRRAPGDREQRIASVLEHFPVLRERLGQLAGSMSGGEQQMLAVSQALLMRPRLLMIDELSLGLAPAVVQQLMQMVRRINAEGTTVVLVEQSVNLALQLAPRIVFMDHGKVLYDGPAERVFEHREIFRAIFLTGGSEVRGAVRKRGYELSPETVLRVTGARARFGGVVAVDGVSLELHAGEIVGLVGPNGAGKTTLFDLISGFVPVDEGSIWLLEQDVTRKPPELRAQIGLGRSFQNVRLFPALTVRENLLVALDRTGGSRSSVAAALWLPMHGSSERRANRRIEAMIETLGLQEYAESFINELSTGTRRIVDIGCILASAPKVLLLDEPSSGLAQAEVEELGPLLSRVARDLGCAVLVTEHDLGLVASISSRLVVLELGKVFREGPPADVLADPDVQKLLAGGDEAALHRSGDRRALEPLLTPGMTREE